MGSRYGFFFGHFNRVRFGSLFAGTVAAIAAGVLGALVAMTVLVLLGAVPGAIGGGLAGRYVLPGARRFLGTIFGITLGACLGATVFNLRHDQTAATAGTMWGLLIGAIAVPAFFGLFIATLNSLPPSRGEG